VRTSFWLEAGLAVLAGVLAVITLLWRDWLEEVFGRGADIDKGGGGLEWLVVVALALVAAACGALARAEWRRRRTASAGVAP
jgi:hypothetical protein